MNFLSRPPPESLVEKKRLARPPPRMYLAGAKPPPEALAKQLLAKKQEMMELITRRNTQLSRPPPKALEKCLSRPPPELLVKDKSSILPPPESLLRMKNENSDIPDADKAFGPMKFFLMWYDSTYPYGEYTGYQDHLGTILSGVPLKVEKNHQNAIRQLNTAFANTKYILIATGKKKKTLIQKIHDNASVAAVFVVKPFMEKVLKWSHALKKVSVVQNFQQLLQELSKLVVSKRPSNYKHPRQTLLSYKVQPDHMIMSQQTVLALNSELEQEEDQLKFSQHYQLAMQILKDTLKTISPTNRNKANSSNPLSSLRAELNCLSLPPSLAFDRFLELLDLSIYFDESKYIIPGISTSKMSSISVPTSLNINSLIDSAHLLWEELDKMKTIDEIKNLENLEKFHENLYVSVLFLATQEYGTVSQWKDFYLIKMLLNDVDLCLKLFLHFSLQESEFCEFDFDFFHAAIVSDTRISVIKEFWDEWRERDLPSNAKLPKDELNFALSAITTRNVIALNSTGLLDPFIKIRKPKKEYKIVRDFLVDWEEQKALAFDLCYIVVEPSLTPSEFNQILDVCISRAITPIFIFYLPEELIKKMAKETFKGRWTVLLLYCTSAKDIVDYMDQIENNMDRDLWQYSQCYDEFGATLSKIKGTPCTLSAPSKTGESDGGWEVLTTLSKDIFSQLVGESSLGNKLTGSLHYYFYKKMCTIQKQKMYWKNYATLFGVTNKYVNILDINCAKMHLRAYTLQTDPAFYKMLNDAFRTGEPDQIARYRAFYTSLHDEVKIGVLKKYIGFVYRGTYFQPSQLDKLKEGMKLYSTCFTSTSKSEIVARNFARKARRNVLLEIELDPKANSNVDLHYEGCSLYPEEQEVLLLPFGYFEVKRVFQEDYLTLLSLKELVPDHEVASISTIEYMN